MQVSHWVQLRTCRRSEVQPAVTFSGPKMSSWLGLRNDIAKRSHGSPVPNFNNHDCSTQGRAAAYSLNAEDRSKPSPHPEPCLQLTKTLMEK